MLVVAVDPGLRTGVALWDTEAEDKPRAYEYSYEEMHTWMENLLTHGDVGTCFVSESFTISARTVTMSRQPASLELIGAMKWLCAMREWSFELQSPASAKSFATDERLRTTGWWVPGKGHANDALRHLFLWAVKHKLVRV